MAQVAQTTLDSADTSAKLSAEEVCQYLTENRQRLLHLIRQFESDEATAEDILSIVTVDALSNLDKFKGQSSIGTYLGALAKNQAIDHVRKAVRRKQNAQVFYAHEIAPAPSSQTEGDADVSIEDNSGPSYATPEAQCESRELLLQVDELLPILAQRFPAAYPTWKLHRIDGLDYKEIEELTKTPARVAFLHVHRVGEALKELMAKKNRR